MKKEFEKVTGLVLQRLQSYLEEEQRLDPQKCKHITATLKDIQELRHEDEGPKTLLVRFEAAAEEAAK